MIVPEDTGKYPDPNGSVGRTVVAGTFEADELVEASCVEALVVNV